MKSLTRFRMCPSLTTIVALVSCALAAPVVAQVLGAKDYDVAYLGAPLADPVAQFNKETYASFGCHYCHGLNLVPRGEAPDLRRSALVGRDVGGDLLLPLLRKGIPQTAALSPMPQFSDLSDQQLRAIAEWIHYARQRDRVRTISATRVAGGDALAGRSYFDRHCASCHDAAFPTRLRKYDVTALRNQILEPSALARPSSYRLEDVPDNQRQVARQRHNSLLENYTADDVAHLVAHLLAGR